jgi:putative membrane protein
MIVRPNGAAAAVLAALVSVGVAAYAAPQLSDTDRTFVTQAVQGGMAEVSDAQLALKKSKDPMVVTFARRMVADHGAANAKLAAILRQQRIDAPKTVGPANLLTHGKLDVLTGATFNSSYLKGERKVHESTISLFRQEIASGRDPQLVAFARSALPTVMAHLAMLNSRSSM